MTFETCARANSCRVAQDIIRASSRSRSHVLPAPRLVRTTSSRTTAGVEELPCVCKNLSYEHTTGSGKILDGGLCEKTPLETLDFLRATVHFLPHVEPNLSPSSTHALTVPSASVHGGSLQQAGNSAMRRSRRWSKQY